MHDDYSSNDNIKRVEREMSDSNFIHSSND